MSRRRIRSTAGRSVGFYRSKWVRSVRRHGLVAGSSGFLLGMSVEGTELQQQQEQQQQQQQQQRRRLTVTVHQCKGLVNKDGLFGKNDVYCVLGVQNEQKRTTTVDEGGAEPVWVGGEQITFEQSTGLHELRVDVFDHDDIGSDDLIGSQSLDLAQYEFEGADEDWSVGAPVWFELQSKNGKKTFRDGGEVERRGIGGSRNKKTLWKLL